MRVVVNALAPFSSFFSLSTPSESQGHQAICVIEEEVAKSIRSFTKSSAGGPDGLRPQRFKDMLLEMGSQDILLLALTSFLQLVLEGRTPATIRPFFFGVNLIKGDKTDSCELHVAGNRVMKEMGILLAPRQLGLE